MATRSLYEIEDVAATLLYALQFKKHKLAVQAAVELRESGENDLLLNLLTFAWLLCDPFKFPFTRAPTIETMYDDLCALIHHFPESLPLYKPQIKPAAQPQQPNQTEFIKSCISKQLWRLTLQHLTHVLYTNMNELLVMLEILNIPKILIDCFHRLAYMPLLERLLLHIVVQSTGLSVPVPAPPPINNSLKSIWNSESTRCFQIPHNELRMWNIVPKQVHRLQYSLIPAAVTDSNASQYWKKAGLPTEENIDTWYFTYFPNDIPDEWSRDEIQKSHVYSDSCDSTADSTAVENDWIHAFLLC